MELDAFDVGEVIFFPLTFLFKQNEIRNLSYASKFDRNEFWSPDFLSACERDVLRAKYLCVSVCQVSDLSLLAFLFLSIGIIGWDQP